MTTEKDRPKVGLGVYILNKNLELLLTLRKNTVAAGTWCPPGGHLEYGEVPEEGAVREALEEVGLKVIELKLWAVTNNVMSNPDRHYLNLDFLATKWSGKEKNQEPEKCEKIEWFALSNLPENLMEPLKNFLKSNPYCLCQSGKKLNECHRKM